MIDFQDASFTYDGACFALNKINLHIAPGEFVCVLGGNGSGKSTFAKHINALLSPDEGDVCILDCNTKDENKIYFIRSQAGMVFQNPDNQLVASLVENDVAFGPENLGVPSDILRQRVTDALAEVGLQGFEKRETYALSGGQKQRVAIAGVLAMNPAILVLDEATAMLDPRGRQDLMNICQKLHKQGMTIVMITHFMEEAAQAERVVVFDQGRIVCDDTPAKVFAKASMLEHLNLDLPFAASLSLELQRQGIPVGIHVHASTLKEELCALLSKA